MNDELREEAYKGSPRMARWRLKFRCAFRGVAKGSHGQDSFVVHVLVATAVLVAAAALRAELYEWCLLVMCIAGVIVAEMFNSALESMAKAITRDHNPDLGNSLDIGSAAVLLASIGASIIGAMIFSHRIAVLLGRP
jgi:diacylglycerol kinase